MSNSVVVVGKFVKLDIHFFNIIVELFYALIVPLLIVFHHLPVSFECKCAVIHVVGLFDSVNIHGIGGLWGISGQLCERPLLLGFSLHILPT